MKLSEKRRQEIFTAVHEVFVRLRIDLLREKRITFEVDYDIAQASTKAASAAILAAEEPKP